MEVLLTVCVCEKELRKGEVFKEVARLLSRVLGSGQSVVHALSRSRLSSCMAVGCTDVRLALQAGLLWLMIAHEQGIIE